MVNGLVQGLGIIDGHLHFYVAEIAMEALLYPQSLAVGMPESVQPAFVVESRRIHHQRIAFPCADLVAQPRWLRIDGELAPVGVHLTARVVYLVEHHDQSWRLNDLEVAS